MSPFFIISLIAMTPSSALLSTLPESILVAPISPVGLEDEDIPSCNCYLEVKRIIPNLPLTKDLKPNSPARAGAVAIYNYNGVPHYAYVESVTNDGMYGHWEHGSHLHGCTFYERFVLESNPYLVGYWMSPTAPPVGHFSSLQI